MINEYIGVLDSGVGGLSILSELYKVMPDKNYIYVGDTKNIPYGTKTPFEVYSYTKDILNYFLKNNVKNVLTVILMQGQKKYYEKTFMEKENLAGVYIIGYLSEPGGCFFYCGQRSEVLFGVRFSGGYGIFGR